MSMPLDGVTAGPNVGVERPMGESGKRLHEWLGSAGKAVSAAVNETTHDS